MVLPYIEMNPPEVYMCSASWTLLPPPSPFHPSGSSQRTSPKHPVLCIEPGLVTRFIYDILHTSMLKKIFFFFLTWTIFKVFTEFVTIQLLLYVLVFWPESIWDLSSPARAWICTACIGRWNLNHWTTREVLVCSFELAAIQPHAQSKSWASPEAVVCMEGTGLIVFFFL